MYRMDVNMSLFLLFPLNLNPPFPFCHPLLKIKYFFKKILGTKPAPFPCPEPQAPPLQFRSIPLPSVHAQILGILEQHITGGWGRPWWLHRSTLSLSLLFKIEAGAWQALLKVAIVSKKMGQGSLTFPFLGEVFPKNVSLEYLKRCNVTDAETWAIRKGHNPPWYREHRVFRNSAESLIVYFGFILFFLKKHSFFMSRSTNQASNIAGIFLSSFAIYF